MQPIVQPRSVVINPLPQVKTIKAVNVKSTNQQQALKTPITTELAEMTIYYSNITSFSSWAKDHLSKPSFQDHAAIMLVETHYTDKHAISNYFKTKLQRTPYINPALNTS